MTCDSEYQNWIKLNSMRTFWNWYFHQSYCHAPEGIPAIDPEGLAQDTNAHETGSAKEHAGYPNDWQTG
jgi:hypothetical protein